MTAGWQLDLSGNVLDCIVHLFYTLIMSFQCTLADINSCFHVYSGTPKANTEMPGREQAVISLMIGRVYNTGFHF